MNPGASSTALPVFLRALLLFIIMACGAEPESLHEPSVRMEFQSLEPVEDQPRALVRLVLRGTPQLEVEAEAPRCEGLDFELLENKHEDLETVGGAKEILEYMVRGKPGSYVIQVPSARLIQEDGSRSPLEVAPLFVDLGVQGPSARLHGILLPSSRLSSWWPWLSGLALVVLVFGLLRILWSRHKHSSGAGRRIEPEPPHVMAIRAWESLMADASLGDLDRAMEMSVIFRGYLEQTYGWPARARSTTEITAALQGEGLAPALVEQATALLEPMDLVKYAGHGGGAGLQHALDGSFRSFLLSARSEQLVGHGADSGDPHGP